MIRARNTIPSLEELRALCEIVEGSQCWNWTRCKDDSGYGLMTISGKIYKTHRMAAMLHFGAIPTGKCVLHHCDNRGCVNPQHLFFGTRMDNMRDCMSKQRHAWGNKIGVSKLLPHQVLEIRAASGTQSIVDLATRFGVHKKTIWDIIHRATWSLLS